MSTDHSGLYSPRREVKSMSSLREDHTHLEGAYAQLRAQFDGPRRVTANLSS